MVEKLVNLVSTKDDFVKFVAALVDDLKNNRSGWANQILEQYLTSMQSWVEDMDGYYINTNQPVPQNINWKVFADMLMAAKTYE